MCRSAKNAPLAEASFCAARGRYGDFIGCQNYPKCKYTRPITLGIKCPKCNEGEFVRRGTSKGRGRGPHFLRLQPLSRLRLHHAARADQRAVPEVRRAVHRREAHQARQLPHVHPRKLRLGSRGPRRNQPARCGTSRGGGRAATGGSGQLQELAVPFSVFVFSTAPS